MPAKRSPPQRRRQLGGVRRDPPCLVTSEQLGRRSSAGLILTIDEGQRLSVGVPDNEARGGFFDGPRWREAAGRLARIGHGLRIAVPAVTSRMVEPHPRRQIDWAGANLRMVPSVGTLGSKVPHARPNGAGPTAFRKEVLALDPCVSEEFMKLYVAYKAEWCRRPSDCALAST